MLESHLVSKWERLEVLESFAYISWENHTKRCLWSNNVASVDCFQNFYNLCSLSSTFSLYLCLTRIFFKLASIKCKPLTIWPYSSKNERFRDIERDTELLIQQSCLHRVMKIWNIKSMSDISASLVNYRIDSNRPNSYYSQFWLLVEVLFKISRKAR